MRSPHPHPGETSCWRISNDRGKNVLNVSGHITKLTKRLPSLSSSSFRGIHFWMHISSTDCTISMITGEFPGVCSICSQQLPLGPYQMVIIGRTWTWSSSHYCYEMGLSLCSGSAIEPLLGDLSGAMLIVDPTCVHCSYILNCCIFQTRIQFGRPN